MEFPVLKDIGKETRYHHFEAISADCPSGMLATASAAEVLARDQYLAAVGGIVEYEIRFWTSVLVVTPVGKKVVAESLARGRFQESSGNDLVGVHILDGKRNVCRCYCLKFFHIQFPSFSRWDMCREGVGCSIVSNICIDYFLKDRSRATIAMREQLLYP